MNKVILGESAKEVNSIWRYTNLEKFIDLLHTKTLYFAPLYKLIESDPFEGGLPVSVSKIIYDVYQSQFPELEITCQKQGKSVNSENPEFIEACKNRKTFIEGLLNKQKFACTVNCWHCNEYESDAMWKIYSDNQGSVAIKSNIISLIESLKIPQDKNYEIKIGKIKYIDFLDRKIDPKTLPVDGSHVPLLKRLSFQHEQELRVYILKDFNTKKLIDLTKEDAHPIRIRLDINKLINEIYISPTADELFKSVIKILCDKYNIPDKKIKFSSILSKNEMYKF